MTTNHSHGALCILQWSRVPRNARRTGHAVFEKRGIDADRIQPGTDLRALEIERQDVIAAARKHDDGRAAVILRSRRIEGEVRLRDITHSDDRFSGDEGVFGGGYILFRTGRELGRTPSQLR